MQILIVVEDSSKSVFGGGQRVTIQIIKALSNNFAEVYCFDHGNISKNSTFSQYLEAISVTTSHCLLAFYQIKPRSKNSSFSLTWVELLTSPFVSLINSVILLCKTYRLVLKTNSSPSDFSVYASTKKSLLECFLLSILGFRIFYHSHNVRTTSLISRIFQIFAERIASFEISVSSSSQNLNSSKSFVLPNSISRKEASLDILKAIRKKSDSFNVSHDFIQYTHTHDVYICSFSNLLFWKGLDTFLYSIAILKQQFGDDFIIPHVNGYKQRLNFHLYGDGDENLNLRKLANEFSLNQNIFKGRSSTISEIMYSLTHITVLPSLDSEACPMSLLESISFGIPVITTNIGGQFEFLPPKMKTYSFNPGDARALAKSIVNFCCLSSSQYSYYAENSLTYSERFSEECYSEQVRNIVACLL